MLAAAWMMCALGIAHVLTGLIWFRKPILAACREGFVDRFRADDKRRLAFWFTLFGFLMLMGGQVALHAVETGDRTLLKLIGFHVLGASVPGVLALPRSPFWLALLIAPVLIAGGYGWLA